MARPMVYNILKAFLNFENNSLNLPDEALEILSELLHFH